jgi:hypothetical protein
VRSVDEMDLPWLSDLVDELRVEQAAVVTLTDPDDGAELMIRIDHERFLVERVVRGVGSRLTRTGRSQPSDNSWSGPPDEPSVDLEAARQAMRSLLLGEDLAPGLRWGEQVTTHAAARSDPPDAPADPAG